MGRAEVEEIYVPIVEEQSKEIEEQAKLISELKRMLNRE
jgi:hypothetical protein